VSSSRHILPHLFLFTGNNINSKVGTDHAANITPCALIAITYTDRMIPSAINLGGFAEDVFWAKLNTEAALLTPLYYHIDLTVS